MYVYIYILYIYTYIYIQLFSLFQKLECLGKYAVHYQCMSKILQAIIIIIIIYYYYYLNMFIIFNYLDF